MKKTIWNSFHKRVGAFMTVIFENRDIWYLLMGYSGSSVD